MIPRRTLLTLRGLRLRGPGGVDDALHTLGPFQQRRRTTLKFALTVTLLTGSQDAVLVSPLVTMPRIRAQTPFASTVKSSPLMSLTSRSCVRRFKTLMLFFRSHLVSRGSTALSKPSLRRATSSRCASRDSDTKRLRRGQTQSASSSGGVPQLRAEFAYYVRFLRRREIVEQWHVSVFNNLRRAATAANFKYTDFASVAVSSGLKSKEGASAVFLHLLQTTNAIIRRPGKYPTYRVKL